MKRFWLALALHSAGCFGPKESVLFEPDDSSALGGNVSLAGSRTNAGADSGTGSGSASGAVNGGGGGVGGNGASTGGAGSPGEEGGESGEMPPGTAVRSCEAVPGSVPWEMNGHCYRVDEGLLTFAQARDACQSAGGHLVTIASTEENDFTRDLHDGEHWLGATDQLTDEVAGVGSYVWVNAEPWSFTDWDDGQPNAYETACPNDNESKCYEHCGFQTDEGGWKDRSCWHTIASICEWEEPATGVGRESADGRGSSGQSPNRPSGPP